MIRRLRPTRAHLAELDEQDKQARHRGAGALTAALRASQPDVNRLDREAVAAGYQTHYGAFRPWYRRHLRELAARAGDPEVIAILDRLDEIAEAQKEVGELNAALNEWRGTVELVDKERVR